MSKFIEIKQDRNIKDIILNRSESYNAFNLEMITELAKHLTQLATDNSVRGITITDDGTALEEAKSMLNRLTKKSTYSFGWSKKLLTDSFNSSLESHLELEREGLSDCANHSDGQEGLKAFIEKRKPIFGNKKPEKMHST